MKQMLMGINWLHVYHVAGFVGLVALLVYMCYLVVKLDSEEAKEDGHACEQSYRDHSPEFLGSVQEVNHGLCDHGNSWEDCADCEVENKLLQELLLCTKHMNFCACCGNTIYGDGFYCHLCFDKLTRK